MVKTGADHLASLRDGRQVFINGRLVADVTTDAAFRNSVRSVASLYDFQAAPDNSDLMTFVANGTGRRAGRAWELPRSHAGLVRRREALERWAELHFGFMGRSPDHVASCLSGMIMGIEVFRDHDPARAAALQDYYAHARDNDLFLSYVLINPQSDHSAPEAEGLALQVVDEDTAGLTVRGAKMLATSGIMSNELLVTCIQPLQPGQERQAVSFVTPMNAKGLHLLSRKSYEEAASSGFDNPLSSRFDENDAVVYFDDVIIPWHRVFINRDIAMTSRQFHATPAHVFQNYQCQIRLLVKLRFLAALGRRITEIIGTGHFPQVRESLGQIAAEVGMVEGLLHGMEAKGSHVGPYFVPDRALLYSAQVLTQQLYPKIIHTLRGLAGGGLIMLPSGVEDFANPALAAIIEKTQRSGTASAAERVQFFKLAWDAVGSEFASRHVQYEMFYSGADFVTRGHAYRTFDWSKGVVMLDRLLRETPKPVENRR